MKIRSLLPVALTVLVSAVASAQVNPTPTESAFALAARSHVLVGPRPNTNLFAVREAGGPPAEGQAFTPRAGMPDIALRMVEIIVPLDCNLATLRLAHPWGPGGAMSTTSLGFFDIAPTVPAKSFDVALGEPTISLPPGVQLDAQGRDPAIYSQNAFWPVRPISIMRTSQLRGFRIVRLAFAPFQWNPVTRELRKIDALPITVSWQRELVNPRKWARVCNDPVQMHHLSSRFLNWLVAEPWYESSSANSTASRFDYVIITTDDIVDDSTQLDDFKAHKEGQGYTVGIFTVEWIASHHSTSSGERADEIRAFLQAYYLNWGIRYALLIGDPDPYDSYEAGDVVGSVPMKMAWPRGDGWESKFDGEACPTDHYYGDLSADWDVDNDGYAAAYDDDFEVEYYTYSSGGSDHTLSYRDYGIDYDMEVLVGRIGFDDVDDIDEVLEATIDYQALDLSANPASASLRQRAYVAMSNFADACDTSYLGRSIVQNHTDPAGLNSISYYEPLSAYSGDHALMNYALEIAWAADPAGLVIWAGHGNNTDATIRYDDTYLMHANVTPLLDDGCRSFVIQASCQNGWPENSGNLQNALMKTVAVAAFAGTRNSWFGDYKTTFGDDCKIQDIEWWLAKGLVEKHSAGYALSEMRAAGAVDEEHDVQNLITYNLSGDPSGYYKFE